jgi:predicted RNA-binding Zn-ribbon protein involved in translation (DUF1610 family)
MGAPTKCPECGKKHANARLCGVHRRFAHGVKGTSASTIYANKHYGASRKPLATQPTRVEAIPTTPTPTPTPDLLSFCPSCGLNLAILRKVTSTLMRKQGSST